MHNDLVHHNRLQSAAGPYTQQYGLLQDANSCCAVWSVLSCRARTLKVADQLCARAALQVVQVIPPFQKQQQSQLLHVCAYQATVLQNLGSAGCARPTHTLRVAPSRNAGLVRLAAPARQVPVIWVIVSVLLRSAPLAKLHHLMPFHRSSVPAIQALEVGLLSCGCCLQELRQLCRELLRPGSSPV